VLHRVYRDVNVSNVHRLSRCGCIILRPRLNSVCN